jgi:DNA ligase (NAD+)
LRGEIDRHNELYYQKAAPEIADAEFDALLVRLKQLEAENPDLITPDSPTQRVGGRAEGFKPFVHRVPLMSLDNSYDLTICERLTNAAANSPTDARSITSRN